MNCFIYRCSAKTDMYLYLAEEDCFDPLPETLRRSLGQLEKVMQLDLQPDTRLAKESPQTVLESLQKQGFHLQMPAEITTEEIMQSIAEKQKQQAQKSPK